MELLKILLGLIALIVPFVIIYGLGRLYIGKKYSELYDFADVMINGLIMVLLIGVGLLVLLVGHFVGDEIITKRF